MRTRFERTRNERTRNERTPALSAYEDVIDHVIAGWVDTGDYQEAVDWLRFCRDDHLLIDWPLLVEKVASAFSLSVTRVESGVRAVPVERVDAARQSEAGVPG